MRASAHHRGALRRFCRDRTGVSAVEFGLILPVMVVFYLGSVELGNGLAVQFKATLAARTVADLTSQYNSLDTSMMTQILGAASTVVTPYPGNNMTVVVSEVTTTNSTGSAIVTWSAASGGSARIAGAPITLPSALHTLPTGTSLIFGEVTYPYNPQFGSVLTGTINMYESQYFYPRKANCVSYNNVC